MDIERGLFLQLIDCVDQHKLSSSKREVEKALQLERGLGKEGIEPSIIDEIRRGITQSLVRGGNFFSHFGGQTLKPGLMYPWEEIDSGAVQVVRGDDGELSLTFARVNFSAAKLEYSPLYLKLRAAFMAGERDLYSQMFGKYPVEQTTLRELHRFNAYRNQVISGAREIRMEDEIAAEFARDCGGIIEGLVHSKA